MHYTRAAIGKGTLPEGQSPKTLDEPPDYVMDGTISAVTAPVDGECQVTIQVNSADVEVDSFFATGILLYVRDPETNEDVPYAYMSMENDPEVIRSKNRAVGKLAIFDMITAVGEVERVTATIDPNALVTRSEVEQLIADSRRRIPLQIPVTGWKKATEDGDIPADINVAWGAGLGALDGYYISIPVDAATADMTPDILPSRESEAIAAIAGVSELADAGDGYVMLYARALPTANMSATLVLEQTSPADE